MREVSSKGDSVLQRLSGYLYSELATPRTCRYRKRQPGSVTPDPDPDYANDDITHPIIPDLTGYITEGCIVLTDSFMTGNLSAY